jgi:hypothetical protein
MERVGLIAEIIRDIKQVQQNVLRVENRDGFLLRKDIVDCLETFGIKVVTGTMIRQRVAYEVRNGAEILILLPTGEANYLADIRQNSSPFVFGLEQYLGVYHLPSILDLDISILEILHQTKLVKQLSKEATLDKVETIKKELLEETVEESVIFDLPQFIWHLKQVLESQRIDWKQIQEVLSEALVKTIGTIYFEEVMAEIHKVNIVFQRHLKKTHQLSKNSNASKSPKIVSKILDYLSFNFLNEKIALIVIDGLAYWQYELLKNLLPGQKKEQVIYSWIPSITQLSRQAIFRGDVPLKDYRQNPKNEEKLWTTFWKSKGINNFEIQYLHGDITIDENVGITKYALVYKDLDDKMHSSTDYQDLLKLTENWVNRSQIITTFETLLRNDFTLFITTDHGNIQAKGWRSLKGREKLGTNKSGSRSARHLEYTEEWLSDEFLENNKDLDGSIVSEANAIYFTDNLSFSTEDELVTHGGAHILEVLIPFITITKDEIN